MTNFRAEKILAIRKQYEDGELEYIDAVMKLEIIGLSSMEAEEEVSFWKVQK